MLVVCCCPRQPFEKVARMGFCRIDIPSSIYNHALQCRIRKGRIGAVCVAEGGDRKLRPRAVAFQIGDPNRVVRAVIDHQRAETLAGVLRRKDDRISANIA